MNWIYSQAGIHSGQASYFYLQNLGIILKTDSMMKIAREKEYITINLIKKLQLRTLISLEPTLFVYFLAS